MGLDENWLAFYSAVARRGHWVFVAHSIHCVGVWHLFRWSWKRDSGTDSELAVVMGRTVNQSEICKMELMFEVFQLDLPTELLCYLEKVSWTIESGHGSDTHGDKPMRELLLDISWRCTRDIVQFSLFGATSICKLHCTFIIKRWLASWHQVVPAFTCMLAVHKAFCNVASFTHTHADGGGQTTHQDKLGARTSDPWVTGRPL